jgi:hypothetical protein
MQQILMMATHKANLHLAEPVPLWNKVPAPLALTAVKL